MSVVVVAWLPGSSHYCHASPKLLLKQHLPLADLAWMCWSVHASCFAQAWHHSASHYQAAAASPIGKPYYGRCLASSCMTAKTVSFVCQHRAAWKLGWLFVGVAGSAKFSKTCWMWILQAVQLLIRIKAFTHEYLQGVLVMLVEGVGNPPYWPKILLTHVNLQAQQSSLHPSAMQPQ